MRYSTFVKVSPQNIKDNKMGVRMSKWLLTHVGIQTLSWEWIYIDEWLHVAFYREKYADAFRTEFDCNGTINVYLEK